MKQYNYILLDWDGNIAHTLDLWPDALDEVLQKRGFKLTRQQLIESTWGFVAYVTKHTDIAPEEAVKALAEANEIVVSRSPDVELFPDAPEVLAELKAKGKHLALITTSERRMVVPVLEKYKIADLFETIITDDDIEKAERKPNPKSLLMALERMGGKPEEAIMVGDRDKDIVAGHNTGTDSVLFCSVEHQRHYSLEKLMEHKPTYVISEFRDLVEIVDSPNKVELKFTQKYALVQLFEDMPEGTQFSSDNWPLHSTVVDTFAIDWDVSTMNKQLEELLATHTQATSVAEDNAFFGPKGQTQVVLLRKTDSLIKLHQDVIELLKHGGLKLNDPQFAHEGFLPHTTVQKHARLNKGDGITFNALTLIDMFPGKNPYQRKVVKTIRIGHG